MLQVSADRRPWAKELTTFTLPSVRAVTCYLSSTEIVSEEAVFIKLSTTHTKLPAGLRSVQDQTAQGRPQRSADHRSTHGAVLDEMFKMRGIYL